jgi:SAM-dependent methyltransferase
VSGSVPFDRAVEYYDCTRGLSEEASREMAALLADELRGRGRCLEVGVGTGLVALPLSEAGVPMVGVDISAPMLGKLVEKAGGLAPFPLVLGDATRLPFADDSFGGVILRHVLHLIPDWERVVDETTRVVSSGGVVIVSRGDIPAEWREVTDRFTRLVGKTSLAVGLDGRELAPLDAAFKRHGAEGRELPPVPERLSRSLGRFLDEMEEGLHSWTWDVEEQARREAVAEVRRWALERFGTLDPPTAREATLEYRAYNLS